MDKIQEVTEQKILTHLGDVIRSIENKPQINVAGIKAELEKIIRYKKIKNVRQFPQIYIDILEYYRYICEFVDEKTEASGPNQVGALSELKKIKDNYSSIH